METIGNRIAQYRKEKQMTQEDLAQHLGVSPQAVSKWENDQTCPDISLLPQLAKLLGVTTDELLSGKQELATAKVLPPEERKDIKDMMLRIVVDSAEGKVRVNVPVSLLQVALDIGMAMPQISGNEAMKNVDLGQIMELIKQGAVGQLVEVESSDGDTVHIYVE